MRLIYSEAQALSPDSFARTAAQSALNVAASWESFEDSGSSGGGSPGDNAGAASFLSNSSTGSDNSGTSPKSAHSDGFYSGSIYSDGAHLFQTVNHIETCLGHWKH